MGGTQCSQLSGTAPHVLKRQSPNCIVTSDASDSWGCGAYEGSKWFQFQWPPTMEALHILIMEMIPAVMAAALWGQCWKGKSVRFRSDNAALWIQQGKLTDAHDALPHSHCGKIQIFVVSAAHIKGAHNDLVDALSRTNRPYFLSHHPQAQAAPTRVPQELVELIVTSQPDCTGQGCGQLFSISTSTNLPTHILQGHRSRYRRSRRSRDCGTNVDAAHYIFITLFARENCHRRACALVAFHRGVCFAHAKIFQPRPYLTRVYHNAADYILYALDKSLVNSARSPCTYAFALAQDCRQYHMFRTCLHLTP